MKKSMFFFVCIALSIIYSLNVSAQKTEKPVKYVFYFIGDGMGLSHIALTEAYLSAINNQIGLKKLTMTKFPVSGLASTYAQTRLITGSAAAGTALAAGHKTSINTIGMNTKHTKPLNSIAYYAKKQGYKVGILSSVSINHATPAAFYAHQDHRNKYYNIAQQLFDNKFDLFGGGGIKEYNGKNKNKQDLYSSAKKHNYLIINSKDDFNKPIDKNKKILMISPNINVDASMPYAINQTKNMLNLADFTSKAIEILNNNDKGFFLMVEGGKIDWAAHNNDAATVIDEVIDFDNAIKQAVKFYEKHPEETIIIITADHETGGLALGYEKQKYESDLKLLQQQKASYEKFVDTLNKYIKKVTVEKFTYQEIVKIGNYFFGIAPKDLKNYEKQQLKEALTKLKTTTKLSKNLYSEANPVADAYLKIFNNKAGVGWTTHSHTAIRVPVIAMGVNQHIFTGFYDNTDIPKKIAKLMHLKMF